MPTPAPGAPLPVATETERIHPKAPKAAAVARVDRAVLT